MATVENGRHAEETNPDAIRHVLFTESKEGRIIDACERKDIDELGDLAIAPGGFLSDHLRSRAWPILLGSDAVTMSDDPTETSGSWRHLPRHRDEEQVKLDVDRSFVYYPNYKTQTQLEKKKSELSDLITQVLREQPYLCYFQGYHDICQVLLLALPASLLALAMSRLSVLRIRDFMLPTLAPAVSQLHLIPDLLRAVDPGCGATSVQRHRPPVRRPPRARAGLLPLRLHAHRPAPPRRAARPRGARHAALRPLQAAPRPRPRRRHRRAAALFDEHPPESLRAWRRISAASVLKTTRDVKALTRQSLRDGQVFFEKQVRELRWDERRQKMMNMAWANRTLLFTILVGISAIYLRKTPVWAGLAAWVTRLGGR
ncbi:hypothetical protein CHU98_g10989 [Xylaria longipes]|nr:hypothetical protein CHU98_g10989 [Xylaria longipes]